MKKKNKQERSRNGAIFQQTDISWTVLISTYFSNSRSIYGTKDRDH